ncbi:right-handed parallel beta-helix repeat-containing protein [Falsiroseomonas tokyonensis]|uniref:Right-handed parallel beta-helix repeat-containing protein n=1 Tax=Falsiroseomonas tokyonensis TaxID=430521 RepID=A0ABV7C0R1_9PROT|nr:right-handed parallel beta-helix repeat-containing protein [Falsiroseomonas tokyonensis]MBU8541473.1 right-handed parallel beta-helix repeat-containing protein [Falsiroseomonas tokyonensis]
MKFAQPILDTLCFSAIQASILPSTAQESPPSEMPRPTSRMMDQGCSSGRMSPCAGDAMTVTRMFRSMLLLLALPAASSAAGSEAPQVRTAGATGPVAGSTCPPGSLRLGPGADLRAAAMMADEGAAFCIAAGEHRLQSIQPRRGQSFHGEAGAILNGSRLVTGFRRVGSHWVAGGQSQRGQRKFAERCIATMPRCSHPEAVFLDDVPLLHAASLGQLRPGHFFLDYATQQIYLAEDPRGRKVEASVAPYAFMGGAVGVSISNLIVEKYASPLQAGAIGHDVVSQDWLVRNNEIRLNYGIGLVVGTGSRVISNRLHHNGNMGAGCVGDRILFEGNEIAGNGHFAGLDVLWEGGGAKCAKTSDLVVRGNHLHGNHGMGFWTDIDNRATLYEDNLVEDNSMGGLSHEISYSAVIRGNRFRGNGHGFNTWLWGGAIQVQNSQDVLVQENRIEVSGPGNGIALIQQDRGTGAYGPYLTRNNVVRDNLLVLRSEGRPGASGLIADYATLAMQRGNNVFDGNQYLAADPDALRWGWADRFLAWDAFRAASGQERQGRLRRLSQ